MARERGAPRHAASGPFLGSGRRRFDLARGRAANEEWFLSAAAILGFTWFALVPGSGKLEAGVGIEPAYTDLQSGVGLLAVG